MGGERASKTRQRQAGKICCWCSNPLDSPPWGHRGERACDRCTRARTDKRIFMHFHHVDGVWRIHFTEANHTTRLPRRLQFADPAKIVETAQRGGATLNLEGMQAIEHGIRHHRGIVALNLTQDQYDRLKQR